MWLTATESKGWLILCSGTAQPSPAQGSTQGMDPRGTKKDPHTQAGLLESQTAMNSRSCPVAKETNKKKNPDPIPG